MDCARFRELLSDAYDAPATAVAAELAVHAAGCPGCRREREVYAAAMDRLGPLLHDLVDREAPLSPFPDVRPGLFERLSARFDRLGAPLGYGLLALAAAASLVVGAGLSSWLTGGGARSESAGPRHSAHAGHAEDCPWRRASRQEISRAVSYPVVADECLDHQFELIEASVTEGRSCAENVRLTYRAGDRRLVLEQHPDTSPTSCPYGEPVLVGEIAGCYERLTRGVSQLRWNHRDLAFELTGDVAAGDALTVARNISASLEN